MPVAVRFSAPVQTGPGVHPASYTKVTGSFLGIKRPGRGVDLPAPSSAEVKKSRDTPLLLCAFVACSRVTFTFTLPLLYKHNCRSQWPRGLRRKSAAARLLRSWVRITPEEWMFVCCECCVLSGRGLCDQLVTRPEESYRLWCVIVCDLETSRMRRP